ncbi:hypothetical protein O3P69_014270 [Scylla paramamosain]|uniref:Uncharacterized protein n=1 Tax=Scylla paramamosain TaxID=85552 RepID=A0AAW0TA97_SCYPA
MSVDGPLTPFMAQTVSDKCVRSCAPPPPLGHNGLPPLGLQLGTLTSPQPGIHHFARDQCGEAGQGQAAAAGIVAALVLACLSVPETRKNISSSNSSRQNSCRGRPVQFTLLFVSLARLIQILLTVRVLAFTGFEGGQGGCPGKGVKGSWCTPFPLRLNR